MEITGQVKAIMPIKETDKFRSIEFVLTDNSTPQYPQHIPMQVCQGKCDLMNGINIGDTLTVSVNLKGREYQDKNTLETKYFLSLDVWKINKNN